MPGVRGSYPVWDAFIISPYCSLVALPDLIKVYIRSALNRCMTMIPPSYVNTEGLDEMTLVLPRSYS